ncbi:hypothetical protein Nepgr_023668 [Nepenthes gracilis]|uniref:Uncharacterized protein n=1 Tax=Nepenthes gracilis TaxID=150966 RepID=A0AAD3XZB5_NEPGR|nr:hypothetical protein Nepgr_023668 [Nepenthes gracilis]
MIKFNTIMERSEPSLVPEWLRSTGIGSMGGSSTSACCDRSLSNSWRTSSRNGLSKDDKNHYSRSYNSFTRNHRDREKERLTISDHWDAEFSNPMRSMLSGRTGKDTLKRSQSMLSRMQQHEALQPRVYADSRSSTHNNNAIGINGISAAGIATGIKKVTFERDFPSLGSGERPATPELSRVPSPGLNRGFQGLSIGNSALICGEAWISPPSEVPIGVGISSMGSTPALQPAAATTSSGAASPRTTGGLNMAEALVQPFVRTQRDEELVLKSKRLIPMTTSLPKGLALNASDKLKPKTSPRSSEPVVTSKNGQLVSLQLNNQSLRGGNVQVDGPKAFHTGKILVLKPGRENCVIPDSKDATSPTTNVNNRHVSVTYTGPASVAQVPIKNPGNPKLFAVKHKAQVQSRTDFFNSVRKKSMNNTSVTADSTAVVSSVMEEKLDEHNVARDPSSACTENDCRVKWNGDAHAISQSFQPSTKEEEEAAFMRSLGWEPNVGDDEGLTEEEINAFYLEYMKLRPASKLSQGLRSKLVTEFEPQATHLDGASL